eukprot:936602-Pyramimonas_sp.AAC.1
MPWICWFYKSIYICIDEYGMSAVGPERYVSGHIKESAAALAGVVRAELRCIIPEDKASLISSPPQARRGVAQVLRGPERQLGLRGSQLRHRRR